MTALIAIVTVLVVGVVWLVAFRLGEQQGDEHAAARERLIAELRDAYMRQSENLTLALDLRCCAEAEADRAWHLTAPGSAIPYTLPPARPNQQPRLMA
jgi:hypothetical protein